ncbi:MAG: OsmC family protein [Spirochaetes bacterium]|nr:OsmC family protein [Spirochaetota bacterium]
MEHVVTCSWKGDMIFEAEVLGHTVRMDADEAGGGTDSSVRPKPLILAALAGCTSMDVISILRKMREPVTSLDVRVEAPLTEEHPRHYTGFTVIYEFRASDGLDYAKVRTAVELSQEKYCGVAALLRMACTVAYRIDYLG